MIPILQFVFFIVSALLSLMSLAIIISAIISWLVAFDVINLRNRTIYSIAHMFEAVTRPILAPFQRFIPTLGGMDVSPIVALLIIQGIQRFLLPAAAGALGVPSY